MDESNATMAQQIARAASAFERQRTGHVPKSVTVILSEDTLVITLREALSPAEKAVAKSPAGAAQLQEFHRQLFANSSDSLRQEIKRITGAQFMDHLLTESGSQPLDWFEITERNDNPPEIAVDDFEQGYWVDVNQAVPAGKLSPNIETLRRDLPEDITAGLNTYQGVNADVIGVSVDSPFAQEAWAQKEKIGITLASDLNKETARAYGTLLPDLLGLGSVSARAAFVIDKNGVIQYSEQTPTPKDLPNFNALQQTLGKLK